MYVLAFVVRAHVIQQGSMYESQLLTVRISLYFVQETIGCDDANSMGTDEDDQVDPEPDSDRFTPQGTTTRRIIADRAPLCVALLSAWSLVGENHVVPFAWTWYA